MFTIAGSPKTIDTEFSMRIDEDGDMRLEANGVPLLFCDNNTGTFYLGNISDVTAARIPEIKIRDYRIVID